MPLPALGPVTRQRLAEAATWVMSNQPARNYNGALAHAGLPKRFKIFLRMAVEAEVAGEPLDLAREQPRWMYAAHWPDLLKVGITARAKSPSLSTFVRIGEGAGRGRGRPVGWLWWAGSRERENELVEMLSPWDLGRREYFEPHQEALALVERYSGRQFRP